MNRLRQLGWWRLLSIAALMCVLASSFGAEQQGKAKKRIKASDIPHDAEIIGSLGKPLGQVLLIRGKWHNTEGEGADLPAFVFRVTEIDGVASTPAISVEAIWIFYPHEVHGSAREKEWDWRFEDEGSETVPKPKNGEEWEMLGVERGFYQGLSPEAHKAIGKPRRAEKTPPFEFVTRFEFIKMRKVH